MFKLMFSAFCTALVWHFRGLPRMSFPAFNLLPTTKQDKLLTIRAAADKVTATPLDYGLTAGLAAELDAAITAAENASADASTYETLKQSKITAAQLAIEAVETLFRSVLNMARFNPAISDEKLADIGAFRRAAPSRVGPPTEAPELSVEGNLGIGFANLRVIEQASRSAAIPADATGIEVSLVDGTVASVDGEADVGVKTFITKSRARINTNIGKARLRVYARYVGRRAQTGPWSLPLQFSPPQP